MELLSACKMQLPEEINQHLGKVAFFAAQEKSDRVHFPSSLREQDAMLAIKALEAGAIAMIADLQDDQDGTKRRGAGRKITVDIDKTTCFLMSAYLVTVDGMGKGNPALIPKHIQGKSVRF